MVSGIALFKQRVFHSNGKESEEFQRSLKHTEKVIAELENTERNIKKWISVAEKFHSQTVKVKQMTSIYDSEEAAKHKSKPLVARELEQDDQPACTIEMDAESKTETDSTCDDSEKAASKNDDVAENDDVETVVSVPSSTRSNRRSARTDPMGKLELDKTALREIREKIKVIRKLANQAKIDLKKERLEWKRANRKYVNYQAKALKCDGETQKKKKEKYENLYQEWHAKESELREKQAVHMNILLERMRKLQEQVSQGGSLFLIKDQLKSIQGIQEEYFENCQDVIIY